MQRSNSILRARYRLLYSTYCREKSHYIFHFISGMMLSRNFRIFTVKDSTPYRVCHLSYQVFDEKVHPKSAGDNANDHLGKKNNMKRLESLRRQLREVPNDPSNRLTLKRSDTITHSWQQILHQAKEKFLESSSSTSHSLNNPSSAFLTDTFNRKHTYLRISLVERCNLRCQYCMPPDGVQLQEDSKLLRSDEIHRITRLFGGMGVDKIRLTGGEPLLRKDLPQIISSIASSSPHLRSIGLTTNGITLSRHLDELISAGLTHVNISLDTLQEKKFEEITRRKGFSHVLQSIHDACHKLPHGRVKVNCVVMRNVNDDELVSFVNFAKDLPIDIRFIEWMPFNENGWNRNRFVSFKDMLNILLSSNSNNNSETIQLQRISDSPNDTTKWYRTKDSPGRVGFITSMSEHFCGTCNRLRITADGQLKVCLFGSKEVSLRDAMRANISDEDLMYIIWTALQKKHFALGGHGSADGISLANDNRPMILIGG